MYEISLHCEVYWIAPKKGWGTPVIFFNFDRTLPNTKILKWDVDKTRKKDYNVKKKKNYELDYTWNVSSKKSSGNNTSSLYLSSSNQFFSMPNNCIKYLMVWVYKQIENETYLRKIDQFRIPLIPSHNKKKIKRDIPYGDIELFLNISEGFLTNNSRFLKFDGEGKKDIEKNKNIIWKRISKIKQQLQHTKSSHVFIPGAIDNMYTTLGSQKYKYTSLLSCLLVHPNEYNMNRKRVKKILKRSHIFLKQYYQDVNRIEEYDPKTHWIEIFNFLPTKVYNYISDKGNGDYVPPYFSKNEDCDALPTVPIHFKEMAKSLKFKSSSKVSAFLKKSISYSEQYVLGLVLCGTKSHAFGTKEVNVEKGYHLISLGIPKSFFGDYFYPAGKYANNLPFLIGESTSWVSPKYHSDSNNFQDKKLGRFLQHKDVGFRWLFYAGDSGFYDVAYQFFTHEFYNKNRIIGFNFMNESMTQYGIPFKNIFENKKFKLVSHPPASKEYIQLAEYDARFKVPPRPFSIEVKGSNTDDFTGNKMKERFSKSKPIKKFLNKLNSGGNGSGKCSIAGWYSKEDLLILEIQNKLLIELKKNKGMKIEIIEQNLLDENDVDKDLFTYYTRIFK
jgi:hypothetical protein